MSDDPRMNAAIDMILDHWYNGNDWRVSMSGEYVKDARERVFHGLKAALDVLGRTEASIDEYRLAKNILTRLGISYEPSSARIEWVAEEIRNAQVSSGRPEVLAPTFPLWNEKMAVLVHMMATMGVTCLVEARRGIASMSLENALKAAFPDPAREG